MADIIIVYVEIRANCCNDVDICQNYMLEQKHLVAFLMVYVEIRAVDET